MPQDRSPIRPSPEGTPLSHQMPTSTPALVQCSMFSCLSCRSLVLWYGVCLSQDACGGTLWLACLYSPPEPGQCPAPRLLTVLEAKQAGQDAQHCGPEASRQWIKSQSIYQPGGNGDVDGECHEQV